MTESGGIKEGSCTRLMDRECRGKAFWTSDNKPSPRIGAGRSLESREKLGCGGNVPEHTGLTALKAPTQNAPLSICCPIA